MTEYIAAYLLLIFVCVIHVTKLLPKGYSIFIFALSFKKKTGNWEIVQCMEFGLLISMEVPKTLLGMIPEEIQVETRYTH